MARQRRRPVPTAGGAVTIRNSGSGDVSLAGWSVSDDDGNEVPLTGTISAGAERVITLTHSAMLNNDGDEVRLRPRRILLGRNFGQCFMMRWIG